jgi:hypothetical protein
MEKHDPTHMAKMDDKNAKKFHEGMAKTAADTVDIKIKVKKK